MKKQITVNSEDAAWGCYAIGWLIDKQIEMGRDPKEKDLQKMMQSYLNLLAINQGQTPQTLSYLLAQKVTEGKELQAANSRVLPHWLPPCMKLEEYRQIKAAISQNNQAHSR